MAMVLYFPPRAGKRGVYNVAGHEGISLSRARKMIGAPSTPIPLSLFEGIIKKRPFSRYIPPYLIDYIKYSTIIDGSLLRDELGYDPISMNLKETLKTLG